MCYKTISLLLLLSGCVHSGASAIDPAPSVIVRVDDLRERAHMRFERVLFLKPEASEVDLPIELAPLLVQDVTSSAVGDALRAPFGAVRPGTPNGVNLDFDRPTVYWSEGRVTIHGREYDERVFAWYRGPSPAPATAQMMVVRLVLDVDGLPMVGLFHELMYPVRRPRCRSFLFVSESLEQAARNRFGDPLPEREYAIEKNPGPPCVYVVRTFESGPVPMGPYVYLDQDGNVTTLLCRCSPSQMDEVVATRTYRLEPIERLLAMRDALSTPRLGPFPLPGDLRQEIRHIEQALRWPYDPPSDATLNENRRDIP